jgi:hypothetical protein
MCSKYSLYCLSIKEIEKYKQYNNRHIRAPPYEMNARQVKQLRNYHTHVLGYAFALYHDLVLSPCESYEMNARKVKQNS